MEMKLPKLNVSVPLTKTEREAFNNFCFVTGMKRGYVLRNAILEIIAKNQPEKKEAENAAH